MPDASTLNARLTPVIMVPLHNPQEVCCAFTSVTTGNYTYTSFTTGPTAIISGWTCHKCMQGAHTLMPCRKQDRSIGPMSSDSLLPLFIAALIVAQPLQLHACLDYVKRFHFYGDWAGQTGFQVRPLLQKPYASISCYSSCMFLWVAVCVFPCM